MAHHEPTFVERYILPLDHKFIGLQYLWTALLMGAVGGFMAYCFRMQLAFPGQSVPLWGYVSPANYNAFITNHGSIMIFWVAMPLLIAAFGNILIPLMVGADDMVFPRLNQLSYQIFFVSILVLVASWLVPGGGFGGSWTTYPPLSARAEYNLTPYGSSLWLAAIALEIISFLVGGINFLTTTMNYRAPGMRMMDIPVVVWMIDIAVVLFMFSVGPLVAGAIMLILDQQVGTSFYVPSGGGDPVLFQHLFWFFGHPEVYVILLPAMGIIAEVLSTFSRKKIFAYKTIIYTTFMTGVLSMVVWAHHQFIAGIDPRMASVFSVTTIMISLPIAVIYFCYVATLYGGSIEFNTPMLFALGFIVEFLVGGLTGLFLGSSGMDIYFHDNTFVVAHFHYTLMPATFFCGFAGLYYWYPKMYGRMFNETLGKIHFWGTTIFFNGIFFPLFILGIGGQHRKIYDYNNFPELMQPGMQDLRVMATTSLVIMLLFQFVFVINYIGSLYSGETVSNNPWNANSLEWVAPSPPGHGNFEVFPTVYRGPYEYSRDDMEEDFLPQNVPSKA
jgi:cytochrome c oxidase subunit 1